MPLIFALNFFNMTSLVINLERPDDLKLFEELAARLGLFSFKLSEADKKLIARRLLVDKMDASANIEVPEELIESLIEADRMERYAQN